MKKKILRAATILLSAALALTAMYFSLFLFWRNLKVSQYELPSTQLHAPLRLAVVADLHSTVFERNELIELLKEQAPDILLLPGDLLDDVVPDDGALQFLAEAADICPAYYVTGNHEYWSHRVEDMKRTIESFGVRVLSDSYETIEVRGVPLLIAGIEDPSRTRYGYPGYDQQASMLAAFDALPDGLAYRILLAHRPEYIDTYLPYGFDLVVAGHTHGGQVILPGLVNGLFAPNQGFFPAYAGGRYTLGNTTMIVSRGIANKVNYPRVFNPPEVAIIDIVPAQA